MRTIKMKLKGKKTTTTATVKKKKKEKKRKEKKKRRKRKKMMTTMRMILSMKTTALITRMERTHRPNRTLLNTYRL
jgi:hypothetical protein